MKLTEKKRIVVKVGTSTLTHDTGKTNIARMAKLVSVLADLKNAGHQVVLVSSGAVGIGAGKLGMHERPDHTSGLQACAAVGQCELMFLYDKLFSEYGVVVSQLLFTGYTLNHPYGTVRISGNECGNDRNYKECNSCGCHASVFVGRIFAESTENVGRNRRRCSQQLRVRSGHGGS